MEEKDELKEILGEIRELNAPIDLEEVILKTIQKEESSKARIAMLRARGTKALIVSGILILILGVLFSLPQSLRSFEYSVVTYTSIILILFVLFIQLEMSSTKFFNQLRKNIL